MKLLLRGKSINIPYFTDIYHTCGTNHDSNNEGILGNESRGYMIDYHVGLFIFVTEILQLVFC